jgi:hypothetical protein
MPYVRMANNKFWGWVVVSLLVGLGIGLGIMMWRTGSLSSQITTLEKQVASATVDAGGAVTGIQQQLASAEASLTALADQNAQLTSDLNAAQAEIASLQGSSTTTTTTTPAIAVTSRTITPSSVTASHTITLTAKVTGSPTSVTMRVYNASKSFDKTFTLHKVSTSGGTQTWRVTAKAPATKGTYSYYATATKGSVKVTMVGASPSKLTVK